ncbi:protein LNK2-like isoform X2 [Brassica napus]|uniref:protein LNK2-like isoform X2 n=1 Tax=Brassica napus TaxID=3708 RepID=UPI002078EBA3|nr:protein LNK2-like isoform X2 [Brassica napus]
MFDWDDEELTNMIWGDEGETDDHIVPFKVRNRKEQGDESNKAVKPAESKTHLHDSKLGGSSSGQNIECMSSWPDSSVSNARKADPGPGSSEPARYDSTRSEKASELGKGPDIFHSTDESKEQGDFDEYGWANIGSFDDLDRMFSSDVPIFGDGSLSGADELWSSSKDVSKPLPSILDSQDLGLDIRTEFEQQENQQFPLTGETNGGPSSQSAPRVRVTPKAEQYHEHKRQSSVDDQPYQQNKMLKFSEMLGTHEAGGSQDPYGQRTLSRRKFVNQFGPSRSSMMGVNLQISAFQRPDVNKNQLMHPSYNPATAISANMVTDAASARPSTMTPQEKLEKLRRRQQMQAMLAIQRQQQQFRHQVPVADQSITQLVDKTSLQGLTAIPSFDPNSSLELDDSGNFATAAVDNPSEFSVLYRLQDVVAKLDMETRTCIRDSLFRLADSAGQRHHTSDTPHSNKTSQDDQEVIPQEKSRYRYAGMLDTETVTNPTDRTVAHLLFHRPFDMSAAKHTEGLESPSSSKMGTEVKGSFPSTRESNKQKAKEEDVPAGSTALGYASNSGSSSTVGERVNEASQGNKRKL